MDETSARETTPYLTNWRYGTVLGYARVFDLVSIVNLRKGLARGRHIVTCTARPRKGCHLHVCLYDVPASQFPELAARERRLDCQCVEAMPDDDQVCVTAHMFTQYSDERYRSERANTAELWHEEVGQYYTGEKIYRTDCLPVPTYLRRCINAYKLINDEDNFLEVYH